ncbi:virulence factor MviN [Knoellia sinensis KCTC 19936]|uniref:Virulence factor MviN n=1 Tax=Knoellia sinensis KCTC 19936 TaxID=1385520 RepID=A0A0A0J6R1_9MICO|nr:lipid II flippase MurJ [Knoellia sinensis]KGN32464.1 virulence factor MviN [Knoellia sinensis KCTC 19936]
MSARRAAAGIAGAAGLIAVTTLFARVAGVGRIFVFADSVRAGGVGEIYQSVNALPNVLFEVAAGGILAAVAVPLIAHWLGAGDRERADRIASVLLTWALVVLVPAAVLLWGVAPALAAFLVDDFDPQAQEVGARLLRIFAVQVPLYGVGIILTGLLQAHRRFLMAALAPLLSSVVVLVSYLWFGAVVDGETAPSRVSDHALSILGWGTTLGVVALSLPLVVPALRTGWRWRPALRLDPEDARRISGLAGAGILGLVAQQAAVLATMWLTNHSGDRGAFPVYQYVQAVYVLPYAVLAVPVAVSAFPALAARTGAGEDVGSTLARAVRGVLVLTGLSVGVLLAAAPAIGAFFQLLDARRGDAGSSPAALAAMSGALVTYAPGLVGFGLTALLTRALYVRGRPLHAGAAVAAGWLVAVVPVFVVGPDQGPGATLRALGLASTLGMSLSGFVLALLVRREWGATATRGAARTAGALVVAAAASLTVGDVITRGRALDDFPEVLATGLGAGASALVAGLLVLWFADREMMTEVLRRGRARRRGGDAP